MTLNIEEMLASPLTSLPEKIVQVCLAGRLVGEIDQLQAELEDLGAPENLAGDGGYMEKAAKVKDLQEQMRAHTYPLRFRALPGEGAVYDAHMDAYPRQQSPDQSAADYARAIHLWKCELVALGLVDPVVDADQADRLSQTISKGQWIELTNAAHNVNAEAVSIPFSLPASVLTQASGLGSLQPEPPAEPGTVSSLAGPDAVNEQPTDMTTTVD